MFSNFKMSEFDLKGGEGQHFSNKSEIQKCLKSTYDVVIENTNFTFKFIVI